jgi:VanZ family protein
VSEVLRQLPPELLVVGAPTVAAVTLGLALHGLRRGRPPAEAWGRALLDGALVGSGLLLVLGTLSSRGGGRPVDLRPLHELGPVLAGSAGRERTWWAAANLALFAPLGALLPLRVRAVDGWFRALAACAALSALVEALQFALGIGRTAAVDDVLVNAAGGLLGYAGLAAARRLARPRRASHARGRRR